MTTKTWDDLQAALDVVSRPVLQLVDELIKKVDVISVEVLVPSKPVFADFGLSELMEHTLVLGPRGAVAKFYYSSQLVNPVLLGDYYLGNVPPPNLLQIFQACTEQKTARPVFK